MGFLDPLFGKPTVASFARQMTQAFRDAGDVTDLRFDAAETTPILTRRGLSTWPTYTRRTCKHHAPNESNGLRTRHRELVLSLFSTSSQGRLRYASRANPG
jgi:hypothetical protein